MAEDRRSTSNRGFASMDAERQRQIASKGGQSVPGEKRSFSQNRALAAQAGRKGGQASHGGGRSPAVRTAAPATGAPAAAAADGSGGTSGTMASGSGGGDSTSRS